LAIGPIRINGIYFAALVIGIMECWNRGMMGLKKTKHEAYIHAQVFCFLFPIFEHSTFPSFQAAHQEDDRKKYYNSYGL
jgi:hypothetical protein